MAREMMFGFNDEFQYMECAACGCLQICEIPSDISKYYPENYYSFKKGKYIPECFLTSFLKMQRTKYYLHGKNIAGRLLSLITSMPEYYIWLKKIEVNLDYEILDVGCGLGTLLVWLRKDGFLHLTGVDPWIQEDIFYPDGIRILKKNLWELDSQFDLILLNHSFEHMDDPFTSLKEIHRLLKKECYAIIRTPVASSFAFKKYGVNWVQWDAPRHFFIHTIKSISIMAHDAGFSLKDVLYDSTELQFWGSEQYLNNIPFMDERSYFLNPRKSIFSDIQIKAFKRRAKELNEKLQGDSACFYLFKP